MLKPKQAWVVHNAKENDCLVVLKTGYGKSLMAEVLPYMYGGTVVVVCPLDAIVNQVVKSFKGILL